MSIQSRSYRPDLDGLRAVAIGLVLAYHAFPAVLNGGFVGVDVFFVISGFLITQIIVRAHQDKHFSYMGFYRRRILRIVPALVVVLATSCLLSWFVLTPAELAWFGRSLAWCAPFIANRFMAASGGYFDNAAYLNPLLHLWSLGVEEQFYLLWPLLIISSTNRGTTRRALIAGFVCSLLISIWGAWSSPVISFYQLSSRTWELALGGLLALKNRPLDPSRATAANVASTIGLALIAGGSVYLSGDEAFPGWWSLVPAGGAALLILSGPAGYINRTFLVLPAMIFIGRISYSLYLWHWPLLAFLRLLQGHSPSAAAAAAVMAVSFAAACLSYYFVESPLRFGKAGNRAVPALLMALAGLTLAGVAFVMGRIPARLTKPTILALDHAKVDWHFPGGFNSGKTSDFKLLSLDSHLSRKALFIGDSHIAQYWARVTAVTAAHPDQSRSSAFATYIGCPPLPGINAPQRRSACDRFFDFAVEQALHEDVDTVVFGAFWEAYLVHEFAPDLPHDNMQNRIFRVRDRWRTPLVLGSADTQAVFAEFADVVSKLVASGRRVFIVLSNPTSPRFDPTSMVSLDTRLGFAAPEQLRNDSGQWNIDAAPFEEFVAPISQKLREIAMQSGAQVIDPRESLCDGMTCAAITAGGDPLYLDSNHVRPFYAREHATFIDRILLEPQAH